MSKATTKMAITFAFKELLLEKPLNKITVNDIAEKCEMNRQTFYYHFHDTLELTEWICEQDAERALKENKTYDTWQEGFLAPHASGVTVMADLRRNLGRQEDWSRQQPQ